MYNNLSFAGLMWQMAVVAIDLGIAVLAIGALRYLQGLMAGVDTTHELSEKDNFAFGISISGNALALAFIMAGVVSGEGSINLLHEVVNVGLYTILGIVLLKVGTTINDKVIFNNLSLKEHVKKESTTAGIIQAVNFIALGIIISNAIRWVEADNWQGLVGVVCIFIIAQILMLLVTRIRGTVYGKSHKSVSWQEALSEGNNGLAIRYGGHIISTAIAVSAANGLVIYLQDNIWISACYWLVISTVIVIVLQLLSTVAQKIVLAKIDRVEEVDNQQNIGVAFIEAAISIAIGLIIYSLLS